MVSFLDFTTDNSNDSEVKQEVEDILRKEDKATTEKEREQLALEKNTELSELMFSKLKQSSDYEDLSEYEIAQRGDILLDSLIDKNPKFGALVTQRVLELRNSEEEYPNLDVKVFDKNVILRRLFEEDPETYKNDEAIYWQNFSNKAKQRGAEVAVESLIDLGKGAVNLAQGVGGFAAEVGSWIFPKSIEEAQNKVVNNTIMEIIDDQSEFINDAGVDTNGSGFERKMPTMQEIFEDVARQWDETPRYIKDLTIKAPPIGGLLGLSEQIRQAGKIPYGGVVSDDSIFTLAPKIEQYLMFGAELVGTGKLQKLWDLSKATKEAALFSDDFIKKSAAEIQELQAKNTWLSNRKAKRQQRKVDRVKSYAEDPSLNPNVKTPFTRVNQYVGKGGFVKSLERDIMHQNIAFGAGYGVMDAVGQSETLLGLGGLLGIGVGGPAVWGWIYNSNFASPVRSIRFLLATTEGDLDDYFITNKILDQEDLDGMSRSQKLHLAKISEEGFSGLQKVQKALGGLKNGNAEQQQVYNNIKQRMNRIDKLRKSMDEYLDDDEVIMRLGEEFDITATREDFTMMLDTMIGSYTLTSIRQSLMDRPNLGLTGKIETDIFYSDLDRYSKVLGDQQEYIRVLYQSMTGALKIEDNVGASRLWQTLGDMIEEGDELIKKGNQQKESLRVRMEAAVNREQLSQAGIDVDIKTSLEAEALAKKQEISEDELNIVFNNINEERLLAENVITNTKTLPSEDILNLIKDIPEDVLKSTTATGEAMENLLIKRIFVPRKVELDKKYNTIRDQNLSANVDDYDFDNLPLEQKEQILSGIEVEDVVGSDVTAVDTLKRQAGAPLDEAERIVKDRTSLNRYFVDTKVKYVNASEDLDELQEIADKYLMKLPEGSKRDSYLQRYERVFGRDDLGELGEETRAMLEEQAVERATRPGPSLPGARELAAEAVNGGIRKDIPNMIELNDLQKLRSKFLDDAFTNYGTTKGNQARETAFNLGRIMDALFPEQMQLNREYREGFKELFAEGPMAPGLKKVGSERAVPTDQLFDQFLDYDDVPVSVDRFRRVFFGDAGRADVPSERIRGMKSDSPKQISYLDKDQKELAEEGINYLKFSIARRIQENLQSGRQALNPQELKMIKEYKKQGILVGKDIDEILAINIKNDAIQRGVKQSFRQLELDLNNIVDKNNAFLTPLVKLMTRKIDTSDVSVYKAFDDLPTNEFKNLVEGLTEARFKAKVAQNKSYGRGQARESVLFDLRAAIGNQMYRQMTEPSSELARGMKIKLQKKGELLTPNERRKFARELKQELGSKDAAWQLKYYQQQQVTGALAQEFVEKNAGKLEILYGKEHVKTLKDLTEFSILTAPIRKGTGAVLNVPKKLQYGSVIARFFAWTRGVVGARYLATESSVMAWRLRNADLLRKTIENPDNAILITSIFKNQDPITEKQMNKLIGLVRATYLTTGDPITNDEIRSHLLAQEPSIRKRYEEGTKVEDLLK